MQVRLARWIATWGFTALLPMMTVPDTVVAASFDCTKASTPVERTICSDMRLSQLDEHLATTYRTARASSLDPKQLLKEQRAWITNRNKCSTVSCITEAINSRIADLMNGPGSPPQARQADLPNVPATALVPSLEAGLNAPPAKSLEPAAPQPPLTVPSTVTRQSPDGRTVQTVVADGIGGSIESAVQNAAENALKQVVGTFIDTEKQVERRTQIAEGIRNETRNVTSKMREYSQGSIQSFDLLESRQDGGFVRVSAKVGVRIDDFRVYLKRAVEGEVEIGKGLFAQAAVEQKQQSDASAIFLDRIVKTMASNDGLELIVGAPRRFTEHDRSCRDHSLPCDGKHSHFNPFGHQSNAPTDPYFLFPVKVNTSSDYIKSILVLVKNLSNNNVQRIESDKQLENFYSMKYRFSPVEGKFTALLVFDVGSSSAKDIYTISVNSLPEMNNLVKQYAKTQIRIEFYDKDNEIVESITSELDERLGTGGHRRFYSNGPRLYFSFIPSIMRLYNYILFTANIQQNIDLVVRISLDTLSKATRVTVKFL